MKREYNVALFGETERGEFRQPYLLRTLAELALHLGNPPPESRGIDFAVQALMYHYQLIFIRVEEEGFSSGDYIKGLNLLLRATWLDHLEAVCTPGVGDSEIIAATSPLCDKFNSILITSEADLYDYLMAGREERTLS